MKTSKDEAMFGSAARHNLASIFTRLCSGDPSIGQKFLTALAKEWRRKNPRPVCPRCYEPMVTSYIDMEKGTIRACLCACE